jgi:hypothetical protein
MSAPFTESRLPRPEILSRGTPLHQKDPFMSRFPILALCLAALPVAAQAQTTPPPAASTIEATAAAFTQCVQTGAMGVPASVTPEAGATTVMSGCTAQRDALVRAAEALIATLPDDQKTMAQEQMRTQLAGAEGQIAEGIRQMRTAQAGTPAPAPAPAQ